MEYAIETKNLTKDFDGFLAVDHLNLSIEKGKITALLGPNGAGKTTTIQMLLDIVTPTEGEIKILGLSFKSHKTRILSRINFSSPYVSLPGNLTVRENLLMFARLYGVKNIKEKIIHLATLFEIIDFLDKQTVSLSTGQITRVNLAKAFINDPELLLLDEPTASLDPDIADKTLSLLQKMQREHGTTILYTSHNMQEIERICDSVIFINKGKVREEGTPADLVKKFGHEDLNDVFISIARENHE